MILRDVVEKNKFLLAFSYWIDDWSLAICAQSNCLIKYYRSTYLKLNGQINSFHLLSAESHQKKSFQRIYDLKWACFQYFLVWSTKHLLVFPQKWFKLPQLCKFQDLHWFFIWAPVPRTDRSQAFNCRQKQQLDESLSFD